MIQILLAAYLVISIPAAFLLWTVLAAAKRGDDQSLQSESLGDDRFLESKTESIELHSSQGSYKIM